MPAPAQELTPAMQGTPARGVFEAQPVHACLSSGGDATQASPAASAIFGAHRSSWKPSPLSPATRSLSLCITLACWQGWMEAACGTAHRQRKEQSGVTWWSCCPTDKLPAMQASAPHAASMSQLQACRTARQSASGAPDNMHAPSPRAPCLHARAAVRVRLHRHRLARVLLAHILQHLAGLGQVEAGQSIHGQGIQCSLRYIRSHHGSLVGRRLYRKSVVQAMCDPCLDTRLHTPSSCPAAPHLRRRQRLPVLVVPNQPEAGHLQHFWASNMKGHQRTADNLLLTTPLGTSIPLPPSPLTA